GGLLRGGSAPPRPLGAAGARQRVQRGPGHRDQAGQPHAGPRDVPRHAIPGRRADRGGDVPAPGSPHRRRHAVVHGRLRGFPPGQRAPPPGPPPRPAVPPCPRGLPRLAGAVSMLLPLDTGPAPVPVGVTETHVVIITNLGTTTQTVTSVIRPSRPFAASGLPAVGSKIRPGRSISVQVSYAPTAP